MTAWRWLGLAWILLAYTALSVLYGVLVPFGEHPDETFHMSYVVWVAEHAAIPNALGADRPERESHQPPLYYLVAATAWKLIGAGVPEQAQLERATLLARNPEFGDPGGRQNNQYLHTPVERLPFRGWALDVQLLRLALLPIGLGIVLATYAVARRARPNAGRLALLAAAAVAFLPQLVFLSGSITNDLLPVLAAAAALVVLVEALRTGTLSRGHALLLGLCLAIGLLSKDSMLTLLPAVALGLVLALGWRRELLRATMWVGIPLLLLYGPYVVRSLALYGSPLGSSVQSVTVPYMVHAPRSPFSAYFVQTAPTLWASFVAYFGWLSIVVGRGLIPYHVLGLVLAAGVALYLARVWRRGLSAFEARLAFLLVATILGAVAGYVWHNREIDSAQGRHLYTALPAFAVLAALGAEELAVRLRLDACTRRRGTMAVLLLGPASAAALAVAYLWPSYAQIVRP